MSPIEPLRIEVGELSLVTATPRAGATELVEIFGTTAEGRELIISIRDVHLERLIKTLALSVRQ